MIKLKNKKECTGCAACYNICPTKCIEMEADKEGFKYPFVDKGVCIKCGKCIGVCPQLKRQKNTDEKHEVYVCVNNDNQDVERSSSGGIFVLLARQILSAKGVVYGAAMDNDYQLKHTRVDNIDELEKLLKSKYIQSDIGFTYKYVKEDLTKNRNVLFCGTPCQISGLNNYVVKRYDNLLLVDFACHGVPSQKVFNEYLKCRNLNKCKHNYEISFRDKVNGWEEFGMSIRENNKIIYSKDRREDTFLKVFLNDIALRESCYTCIYKKSERISDITLADAWCINEYDANLYNSKGTSLIIIHTLNGEHTFAKIRNKMCINSVAEEYVIKYSYGMFHQPIKDRRRRKFYKQLGKKSFDKLAVKYDGINFITRVERKLNRTKKKYIKF